MAAKSPLWFRHACSEGGPFLFFSTATPKKLLKRAPKLPAVCTNCQNQANHDLYWIVVGRYLKYMGQVVAGKKIYCYVCPICQHISKEITREQAEALMHGGYVSA
jgi:hypothetical protein